MSALRALTFALVVIVGLLAASPVSAQAHGSPSSAMQGPKEHSEILSSEARAAKLAELETWLRRLTGKFSYSGQVKFHLGFGCSIGRAPCEIPGMDCSSLVCYLVSPATGVASCGVIGEGAGVHCMINVKWRQTKVVMPPSLPMTMPIPDLVKIWPGRSLAPATVLYGIDPDKLEVRYLLIDGRSIAESATGVLQDDTVTFKVACVDASFPLCSQKLQIRASPREPVQAHLEIRRSNVLMGEYSLVMSREAESLNTSPAKKSR